MAYTIKQFAEKARSKSEDGLKGLSDEEVVREYLAEFPDDISKLDSVSQKAISNPDKPDSFLDSFYNVLSTTPTGMGASLAMAGKERVMPLVGTYGPFIASLLATRGMSAIPAALTDAGIAAAGEGLVAAGEGKDPAKAATDAGALSLAVSSVLGPAGKLAGKVKEPAKKVASQFIQLMSSVPEEYAEIALNNPEILKKISPSAIAEATSKGATKAYEYGRELKGRTADLGREAVESVKGLIGQQEATKKELDSRLYSAAQEVDPQSIIGKLQDIMGFGKTERTSRLSPQGQEAFSGLIRTLSPIEELANKSGVIKKNAGVVVGEPTSLSISRASEEARNFIKSFGEQAFDEMPLKMRESVMGQLGLSQATDAVPQFNLPTESDILNTRDLLSSYLSGTYTPPNTISRVPGGKFSKNDLKALRDAKKVMDEALGETGEVAQSRLALEQAQSEAARLRELAGLKDVEDVQTQLLNIVTKGGKLPDEVQQDAFLRYLETQAPGVSSEIPNLLSQSKVYSELPSAVGGNAPNRKAVERAYRNLTSLTEAERDALQAVVGPGTEQEALSLFANEKFSRLFPGQGGGSGSAEGAANLARTNILNNLMQSGTAKLATGVGLGASIGGPVGALAGGVMTSPLTYKYAIKGGHALSKNSNQVGSLINQSVIKLDDGTTIPSIYDLLLKKEEQNGRTNPR